MSQNFIKVFFNFPHVSQNVFLPSRPFNQIQSGVSEFHQIILQSFCKFPSQPIKTECLRISSRYFFNFPHVSPRLTESLEISSEYFSSILTFHRSQSNASVSEIHQSIFISFPHIHSQPIKRECLRISLKCF